MARTGSTSIVQPGCTRPARCRRGRLSGRSRRNLLGGKQKRGRLTIHPSALCASARRRSLLGPDQVHYSAKTSPPCCSLPCAISPKLRVSPKSPRQPHHAEPLLPVSQKAGRLGNDTSNGITGSNIYGSGVAHGFLRTH